jgi:hypothetical protein
MEHEHVEKTWRCGESENVIQPGHMARLSNHENRKRKHNRNRHSKLASGRACRSNMSSAHIKKHFQRAVSRHANSRASIMHGTTRRATHRKSQCNNSLKGSIPRTPQTEHQLHRSVSCQFIPLFSRRCSCPPHHAVAGAHVHPQFD